MAGACWATIPHASPAPHSLSAIDALLAIEEIKRLFAARLRCMDTKQWRLYAGLHTDDVVSETWGGLPEDKQPRTGDHANRVVGNAQLADAIRTLLDGPVTVTTAHHGHSHEKYRKVDGRWLISNRTLTRLRVDASPGFFRFMKAL